MSHNKSWWIILPLHRATTDQDSDKAKPSGEEAASS